MPPKQDEALEYRAWPKILMAFDSDHLTRSWAEIKASDPPDKIERFRRDYPTVIPDGEKLWCGRLPSMPLN